MLTCVISGGPGVGKSKLLEALAEKGYPIIEESARMVKMDEQYKQKDIQGYVPVLPDQFPQEFQQKVFRYQMEMEKKLKKMSGEVVFMDRSLVDILGYSQFYNIPPPTDVRGAIFSAQYNTIFILDPLPSILYKNDEQRQENAKQSAQLHSIISDYYHSFAFSVYHVPYFPSANEEESIQMRRNYVIDLIRG